MATAIERVLIFVVLFGTAVGLEANTLTQTHPSKRVDRDTELIYEDTDKINTIFNDGYPWFSNDGKLMLFTRQKPDTSAAPSNPPVQSSPEDWDVWVSYFQNRDDIAATDPHQTLGNADFARPVKLETTDDSVLYGSDFVNTNLDERAIAYCQKSAQPASVGCADSLGCWRYTFTLFFSRGNQGMPGDKKMYRADNVVVKVNKSNKEIRSVTVTNGSVNKMGTNINKNGKNTTEPMLTRDGRYLFWASQNFTGTEAGYMEVPAGQRCTHHNQTVKFYHDLPAGRFAWKNQYESGLSNHNPDPTQLSKTNYHTILEQLGPSGAVSIIFEQCRGQVIGQGLDVTCQNNSKHWLKSTGFSGSSHSFIANASNCMGIECLRYVKNGNEVRASHPAVSGPKHPTNETWLLFYMRGESGDKNIWYTLITD